MTIVNVSHHNTVDTATPCRIELDGVTLHLGRMSCLFLVRDLADMLIAHKEHGKPIWLSIETMDGVKVEREISSFTARNMLVQVAAFV